MKLAGLYIMSLLYIAAGIWHFMRPRSYMKIMPPWLPWHLQLVYLSGAAEILLGILLVPESTRVMAAWGIIALLIAVFPANIQMTINYFHYNNPMKWITVARLPLQIVLIWLAWTYTR
ncbi:MAG: DoxX family protein [Chitinophagaceae bacterium]